MRKPAFCICKTKTQISFGVTAKLNSAFVFATRKGLSLYFLYIRNFKPLAILCGCTAWFVSDLVGNPEDRFSHNEAHIQEDFSSSSETGNDINDANVTCNSGVYFLFNNKYNEKRDNKQCLLEPPPRVTVTNKRLISKHKSQRKICIYTKTIALLRITKGNYSNSISP